MAMQISPEQTDWLTKFLAQNVPPVTPEMAINTAGTGAQPGLGERFDTAVNNFGKMIFGDAGRVITTPHPQPAPEPVAPPVAATPTPAPNDPAPPEPAQPGLMERFDGAVNDFGKMIFGDAGRVGPGNKQGSATPRPEPAPQPVPVPVAATPEPAPNAPPAPAQPGLMERFDGAVNDFGKMIFGDAGH